jgi:hypothetical protein
MTVCITAFREADGHGEEAQTVTASDHMVSMADYLSADNLINKDTLLGCHWCMQFAGDDLSPTVPIAKELERAIEHQERYDRDVIARLASEIYANQRKRQIEEQVLGAHCMTWTEYQGQAIRLSSRMKDAIEAEIRDYDLGLTLLVSGLDRYAVPHIFTVTNPGTCSYYDKLGFWAIGSGHHAAVASLFATQCNPRDSLAAIVLKVITAKFAAESAMGVGKETTAIIRRAQQGGEGGGLMRTPTITVPGEFISGVRTVWDSMDKFPKLALSDTEALLAEHAITTLDSHEPKSSAPRKPPF